MKVTHYKNQGGGEEPEEDNQYGRSFVRILRKEPRESIGSGFLVDETHIITCAHVVAQALHNADKCPPPKSQEYVTIDFPFFANVPDLSAYVVQWKPYRTDPHQGEQDDIAILALTDDSAATITSISAADRPAPADVVECGRLKGHSFEVYGYPAGYKADGAYAFGIIQNRKANRRYQTQSSMLEGGAKVQKGFSGAPVFDTEAHGIVGIIVQSMLEDSTATIIPNELLAAVWDELKASTRTTVCEPTSSNMVFLSYARSDRKMVEQLYDRLRSSGFRPWMDVRDLFPGELWEHALTRALNQSDFFIACLSQNSVDRRGILQLEIGKALCKLETMLSDDIYLIPVRLDEVNVPDSLRKLQWIDLFDSAGCRKLEKALQEGIKRRTL